MQFRHPLISVISEERLQTYRCSSQDDDTDLLGRYLWNLQLCEALYPSFNILEVALRNSLNDALISLTGTQDWYRSDSGLLHTSEQRSIDTLINNLTSKYGNFEPGQVIAGMNFGFWTALFKRKYENEQVLWPHLLIDVFPMMPRAQRTRRTAAKRLNELRGIRNRVFHHEPIWNRNPERIRRNLFEAIEWISPAACHLVNRIDRSYDLIFYNADKARNIIESSLEE